MFNISLPFLVGINAIASKNFFCDMIMITLNKFCRCKYFVERVTELEKECGGTLYNWTCLFVQNSGFVSQPVEVI
jgi:hypothetical protein